MPVFFNGRTLITPTTRSAVDDTALANRNPVIGNTLAIIGSADGGRPNTPIVFGDPVTAKKALVSGELMEAVVKAFDPSPQTPAPSRVVALRVDPATQSTITLLNGAGGDNITLLSTDYGLHTNQIQVRVQAGTVSGKRLTLSKGTDVYTKDNIARRAFQIQYTGAQATATITIGETSVTLEAPLSTTVATANLATFQTIRQLVDYLDSIPDFTVTVLDGNDDKPAFHGLDHIEDQDVKTAAYVATANLQAVVDWLNSNGEGFVDAERVVANGANVGTSLANIAATFLAGGTDGTITNTQWSDALVALQPEDVQWLVPLSDDPAIHAMVDAHVHFMSEQANSERRAVCGGPSAESVATVIANAGAIGSDRTSLVYPGHFDYDSAGVLVEYPPYMTAAIIGAMFAGVAPGEALTNKAVNIRGLEVLLQNPTDTDQLIEGGVLCLERTPTAFKVVKSITTWLIDDNFNRVEQSTGAALDAVVRAWRGALDVLRGERGTPELLVRAKTISDTTLRALAEPPPNGPGVIVGDADNPPFKNITVSIDGDVLRAQAQVSPVIPANFVLITVYAVPFSATVTV